MTAIEPIQCVACGQEHIKSEEDLRGATRVGISFVARECAWTLKYPGRQAHEVIEALEQRLGSRPDVALQDPAPAADEEVVQADPDDPATHPEQVSTALTGQGHRVPCTVCKGDGEVGDPPVPCGRCGGDGTIVVTG